MPYYPFINIRVKNYGNDNQYIDANKIRSYQNYLLALEAEKTTIRQYGIFSQQARDAEKASKKAKSRFEFWRKK